MGFTSASPSLDRFYTLKTLKEKTHAIVGVHMMPIVPYFTDRYENLERIYYLASKIHADYVFHLI